MSRLSLDGAQANSRVHTHLDLYSWLHLSCRHSHSHRHSGKNLAHSGPRRRERHNLHSYHLVGAQYHPLHSPSGSAAASCHRDIRTHGWTQA